MYSVLVSRTLCLIKIIVLCIFSTQASSLSASTIVKKSSGGICHPPQSSWYERTSNFIPFDSVKECLNSGGRLPSGMSLASLNKTPQQTSSKDYRRSAFGTGWDDVDGDCQNSRAEALVSSSNTQVEFATRKRCRVVSGRWVSPFTGNVIQNASDIDIDHVVPLAWSWDRGAKKWSREKREKFANDPTNLWPVELSLNRSKGAQGPDKWLPPSGQCGYVARFSRIVKKYRLALKGHEVEWIQAFLNQCRN